MGLLSNRCEKKNSGLPTSPEKPATFRDFFQSPLEYLLEPAGILLIPRGVKTINIQILEPVGFDDFSQDGRLGRSFSDGRNQFLMDELPIKGGERRLDDAGKILLSYGCSTSQILENKLNRLGAVLSSIQPIFK